MPLTPETTPLLPGGREAVPRSRASSKYWLGGILAFAGLAAVAWSLSVAGTKTNLGSEITRTRLLAHLTAFAEIAKRNNGTRAVASGSGYLASVDHVYETLKKNTDFIVQKQRFTFPLFQKAEPGFLRFAVGSSAISAFADPLMAGKDFDPFSNSGNVSVSNALLQVISGGCDPADFAGLKPGSVALISRETPVLSPEEKCIYRQKVTNARLAGAAAALVYSNLPGDLPFVGGTNADNKQFGTVGITHAVALYLLQRLAAGDQFHVDMKVSVKYVDFETFNVLAETKAGSSDNVIVAGSHLDSVPAGPGINDDASGTSATLEVALSLYRTGLSKKVVNKVRFAWWSAEELGLIGSTYYVDNLAATDPAALKRIALNLNNDMIASPNGARFIYNGREAEDPALRGPSGRIQTLFETYFDNKNLPHLPTAFNGRSDYGEFLKFGIPAGGLDTGAEGIKSQKEYELFGGTPGIAYDPCYHLACDTLQGVTDSLGLGLLVDLGGAIGHVVQKLAFQDNLRKWLNETIV